MKHWTVIGLCGITNSGKTSVSLRLKEMLPNVVHIKQDEYFLSEHDPRHVWVEEVGHCNWELLSSLDMDRMVNDLKTILKSKPAEMNYLIIDGFILYSDVRIPSLCDYKFYFDLDYKTCKARRLTRTYDPPDVPGYFDKVVWPEAMKSRQEMLQNVMDIVVIDATQSLNKLVEIVLGHVKNIR